MKTTAEMIEVMQAFVRGETIEVKAQYSDKFCYLGSTAAFDWRHNDYRIAEKTKRKIKIWLWLMKDSTGYYRTVRYFADPPFSEYAIIGKIESSMIEVDE